MSVPKADLTTREKITVWLVLWLIQILSPWEYSHEQTAFINKIKSLCD